MAQSFAAEIADHLLVALGLVRRRERVDVGELGPGERHHLGGGVQLHRAGPERDHRPVERQVAVGEPPHVAGDLRLGPVHVKDRMRQVVACPDEIFRQPVLVVEVAVQHVAAEGPPDRLRVLPPRPLVEA